MSYLRFTPGDYQAIARVSRSLDLRRHSLPVFRLVLSVSLLDDRPDLAGRILRLRNAEIRLVQDQLRDETRQPLTAEEMRAVAEACLTLPTTSRFARPVRTVLVKHFRKESPGLAHKLGRMSLTKFVRVFEQVRGRRGEP